MFSLPPKEGVDNYKNSVINKYCRKHNLKVLFFCRTCSYDVLCLKCWETDHVSHPIQPMDKKEISKDTSTPSLLNFSKKTKCGKLKEERKRLNRIKSRYYPLMKKVEYHYLNYKNNLNNNYHNDYNLYNIFINILYLFIIFLFILLISKLFIIIYANFYLKFIIIYIITVIFLKNSNLIKKNQLTMYTFLPLIFLIISFICLKNIKFCSFIC